MQNKQAFNIVPIILPYYYPANIKQSWDIYVSGLGRLPVVTEPVTSGNRAGNQ